MKPIESAVCCEALRVRTVSFQLNMEINKNGVNLFKKDFL